MKSKKQKIGCPFTCVMVHHGKREETTYCKKINNCEKSKRIAGVTVFNH